MSRRARTISLRQRATLTKRALGRMVSVESSEQALWLSVIAKAVDDLTLPPAMHDRRSAERYFNYSEHFGIHCDMLNMERDQVLAMIRHAGLLGGEACTRLTA